VLVQGGQPVEQVIGVAKVTAISRENRGLVKEIVKGRKRVAKVSSPILAQRKQLRAGQSLTPLVRSGLTIDRCPDEFTQLHD
jgi:hypothetical protein